MTKFNQKKLEEVAKDSLYTTFTNSMTITYSYEIFSRFLINGSILELGPAEGLMTEKLAKHDPNIVVIEGSKNFSELLSKKLPNIKVINSLFEDAQINEKFDNIILGHVLEHVADPVLILETIKKWLNPNGRVISAVPNARSIHRQAAVEMGLINSIFEMSEKDVHHGHLRIYTPETFHTDFLNAGYKILQRGGYWLKPISDNQIQKHWDENMLKGFMKLGEFYPDIAAEIYIVSTLE